jgi:hypothetical protein
LSEKKPVTRVDPETKLAILKAIRDHIQKHGRTNWAAVRSRWPDLLEGKDKSAEEKRFFRLVREATNVGLAPAEAKAEALRKARGATKRNLPAVPPSTFLTQGADAQRSVDIMSMLHTTLADIMLTRDLAVVTGPDGKEKVRNPVAMDSSIKRRLEIVNTFLAVFREVYDLQRMREFYQEITDIIVEEIHPLDPAVSERILIRLKELNDRECMTIHASA